MGRRDDLESLGYCLLHLLTGHLPWEGVQAPTKAEKREIVFQKKTELTLETICEGAPIEFQSYISYCRSLRYEDVPNYDLLRGLFTAIAEREGIEYDGQYDWISPEITSVGSSDLGGSAGGGGCATPGP